MVQKKFPKTEEYTDKVIAPEAEIMESWTWVTTNAHDRAVQGATQTAAAPPSINTSHPIQDGGENMKLIGEIKPKSLTHDSSAKDIRMCKKKFESYYAASNMDLYLLSVQQAHLLNCLDRELSLQHSGYYASVRGRCDTPERSHRDF